MGCNCSGNRLAKAATDEYVVVGKDGSTTTGYESEIQAKVAAAKLGGVVKTQPKA